MASEAEPLAPAFYERPALAVAPDLLGKLLLRRDGAVLAGRIVEVEAYSGSGDPAAHSRNGRTARNASMFGPAGRLYVYLIYGMHWCANVVCAPAGCGDAVLLRAVEPVRGAPHMAARRGGPDRRLRPTDLCSGPAKLTQAFGIDGNDDGCDLTCPDRFSIGDDGWVPADIAHGPRIGISRGNELPWRFYDPASDHVSKR